MDAIADHIWQSTICAAGAGVLAFMFRSNSASVRYWIWFAAAVKFLVPLALLAAALGRFPLPQASVAAGVALNAATLVFRASAVPQISGTPAAAIAAVWLMGTVVVLGRFAWLWQRLMADARQAPPIVDGVVFDTLRSIEQAEGMTRHTRIAGAAGRVEPGVIGAWKPVLVWPRHLAAGLTAAQIDTIVAHEVCHIVRRDNLLASVQIAVCALFWFHPVVWWIGARLVDERERACDERVLSRGRSAATYAESILKTCQLCIASPVVNVAGVTGGDLKRRIMRIMGGERLRPLNAGRKVALLVAAFMLLLLPTAAGVSGCRSEPETGTGTAPAVAVAPPQNADEVNRPGGNVTTPRLLRETKPEYPQRAMAEKIQGEVLMECVVKADGTVGDKKVVKSLHPDLDRAALDAAAQWVFEPGTRDGKPVNVLVTIAMAFTLK